MLQRTITAVPGLHQLSGIRINVQRVKTGQLLVCLPFSSIVIPAFVYVDSYQNKRLTQHLISDLKLKNVMLILIIFNLGLIPLSECVVGFLSLNRMRGHFYKGLGEIAGTERICLI